MLAAASFDAPVPAELPDEAAMLIDAS